MRPPPLFEANELVLQRFANKLPVDVPWVRSRMFPRCQTDVVIIDPVWNAKVPEAEAAIPTFVEASLKCSEKLWERVSVIVLLGDETMIQQLSRRATDQPITSPVICFPERLAGAFWRRPARARFGVIGLSYEGLSAEAGAQNVGFLPLLGAAITDASLALLGHAEPRQRLIEMVQRELAPTGR